MQRIHFINIGDTVMFNLAIALKVKNSYVVSGSDVSIPDIAYSHLQSHDLLPEKNGWFPEKVHKNLNAVILGPEVTEDNPELLEAKKLGITIFSYPDYLFKLTRSKTRIIVSGCHGKTTIIATILYVLKQLKLEADYVISSQLEGFDNMVKLSYESRIAVIEGKNLQMSEIESRSVFHFYKPHIAIITGIERNFVNNYPSFKVYKEMFRQFIGFIETQGRLIYYNGDEEVNDVVDHLRPDIVPFKYNTPEHEVKDGITYLKTRKGDVPLKVFGEYYLQDIEAARFACKQVGVNDDQYYRAISEFEGVPGRLQKIAENENKVVFKDVANTPSKVKAAVNAVKNQFSDRKLVLCLELSSIKEMKEELAYLYTGSVKSADVVIVFFNQELMCVTDDIKKETALVKKVFSNPDLDVLSDVNIIKKKIKEVTNQKSSLLFISPGNSSGIDLNEFINEI